jgi:ABC-2 type transport system permease protein
MLSLMRIELYKIFKRPRTYISFVGLAALTLLLQLAFYADGEAYVKFGMAAINGFEFDGIILNGYLVCFIILQTLLIQVPLLVAFITGDSIAGEANMGTLRLLVSKPISRTQLILSKFFAGIVYTMILLLFLAVVALGMSLLIFKNGDLMVMKSMEVQVLDNADVFWRYLCAFAFATLALSTVAALGLFLSVFSENSVGPIVTTMVIIIFFTIISTMDTPLFSKIKQFIFTTHMIGWKGFFNMALDAEGQPIVGSIGNLPHILKSAGILVLHIVGFVGGAIYFFRKKDILS